LVNALPSQIPESSFKPKDALLVTAVGRDWLKVHSNIRDVAERRQPALAINKALGGFDDDYIHLLITASKAGNDRDSKDGSDTVSELPMAVMIRRKSRVSILQFHVALNPFRSRRSQDRETEDPLRGCPVQRLLLVPGKTIDSNLQWVFRVRRAWRTKTYHHRAPGSNFPSRFPAVFGQDRRSHVRS
jgi:hypothetical protein